MTLTTIAASERARRNDAERVPALKPTRSLATLAPVADTKTGLLTPGTRLLMSAQTTPTGQVPKSGRSWRSLRGRHTGRVDGERQVNEMTARLERDSPKNCSVYRFPSPHFICHSLSFCSSHTHAESSRRPYMPPCLGTRHLLVRSKCICHWHHRFRFHCTDSDKIPLRGMSACARGCSCMWSQSIHKQSTGSTPEPLRRLLRICTTIHLYHEHIHSPVRAAIATTTTRNNGLIVKLWLRLPICACNYTFAGPAAAISAAAPRGVCRAFDFSFRAQDIAFSSHAPRTRGLRRFSLFFIVRWQQRQLSWKSRCLHAGRCCSSLCSTRTLRLSLSLWTGRGKDCVTTPRCAEATSAGMRASFPSEHLSLYPNLCTLPCLNLFRTRR